MLKNKERNASLFWLSRIIAFALFLLISVPGRVESQTVPSTNKPLTNEDVIELLEAGLSPEIVTAKIRSSLSKFDTSPAALKHLKAAHVPDSVILAVVQAPQPGEETVQTAHVKCAAGATEVSVWLAPGKLTEVASPKCGERVDILEERDLWVKARTQEGKVGYIARPAISESWEGSQPTPSAEHPSSTSSPNPAQPPAPRQKLTPIPPTVRLPRSDCSPAIESTIAGDFEGWSGETIFKLDNGQIWEQAEYDYTYEYDYRPDVTIYQTSTGCRMKVEGVEETILVRRIH